MTDPATPEQIAHALAAADGVLAAAGHHMDPADRAASNAEIARALRGEISFDEAIAAGLERIKRQEPQ